MAWKGLATLAVSAEREDLPVYSDGLYVVVALVTGGKEDLVPIGGKMGWGSVSILVEKS